MKTLICDLDNTLVECGIYYRAAVSKAARSIASETGLEESVIAKVIDLGDGELIKLRGTTGFKLQRFFDSIEYAGRFFELLSGQSLNPALLATEAQDTIEGAPYAAFAGVHDTLRQYRDAGWRLLLWTKGERWLQAHKVDKNNFGQYFDVVGVTPIKDVYRFALFLNKHAVDPATAVMVGDSFRDDVTPALELGLQAVHISGHTGPPGYEPGLTHAVTIEHFAQLPEVVPVELHGAAAAAAGTASTNGAGA